MLDKNIIKIKGSKGGRPSKIIENVLNKLIEAFSWGCTDLEACNYAGISHTCLYNYQKKYPEFIERKETLKHHPTLLARRIIHHTLTLGEDVQTAKYIIDKTDGRPKQAIDIKSDLNLTVVRKMYNDNEVLKLND